MPLLPHQVVAITALAAVFGSLGIAAAAPAVASQEPEYASVGGVSVSVSEFQVALAAAVRNRYYHRQPRPEQLAALRAEVTDRLVDRILLLQEARRLGLQPDEKEVQAGLAAFEGKLGEAQRSAEIRERWLPALAQNLREKSLIAQLERTTRTVRAPAEAELRGYYDSHPGLFTEPERVRLSVIILKVDPSSPAEAWGDAQEQARGIARMLSAGADFAEMARRHSSDASAGEGGDLGYRHSGMLPQGIEREIDKLPAGAISEPIRLLEGFAILRLVERRPAQLKRLEDVRRTAGDLWAREQGEIRWRDLIANLRSGAVIRVRADPPPVADRDKEGTAGRTAR